MVHGLRCLLLALACLSATSLAARAQGMAAPDRTVPSGVVVDSTLPFDVHFVDIAEEAGLTARNVSGAPLKKQYILEAVGNGVVLFDYDNDGLVDVFLANGSTLDGSASPEAETHRLYRNLGNLRFEDVTESAGLTRTGWGQGACVGDYDNDGWRDLFVTFWGQSVLYRNNGDGTFTDVTEDVGLSSTAVRWDTGCTFFDFDLDGTLDLVVTGYVDFKIDEVPLPGSDGYCRWKGLPVMCGPRGLPAGRNYLFRNDGKGRFEDVSEASGIAEAAPCYGFTAIASDFDNDGLPDLYVACDSTPSLLYRNLGDGTFEEIGILTGAALNEDGQEQAGMGVAVADYNEDGFVDILKTNFSDDTPNLYHNNGDGTFSDHVYVSGLGIHTQYLGWGAHVFDVDHDGRSDILLVNGHVYPDVDEAGLPVRYRQQRLLYHNVGGGRFADASERAGPGITTAAWSSRGSAVGDLDNDGSLEVVISNMGDRPSLLKNQGRPKNWLMVRLIGTHANRDAIGARVYVFTGEGRISREAQGGSGYLSQNDARLHFGLGDATRVQRVEVQWPGGARELFDGAAANQLVVLTEGEGEPVGTATSHEEK